MTMQLYCYNGYGISTEPFYLADFEILKKILKETFPQGNFEKIHKISQFENIEELSELNIPDNILGNTSGYKAVIASLISAQEHITLTVATNEEESAIIFEPVYPWTEKKQKEKELTEDKLVEIFQKWQDILKVPESKQREAYYMTIGGYC